MRDYSSIAGEPEATGLLLEANNRLRAHSDLAEDSSSRPNIHTGHPTCNSNSRGFEILSNLQEYLHIGAHV